MMIKKTFLKNYKREKNQKKKERIVMNYISKGRWVVREMELRRREEDEEGIYLRNVRETNSNNQE